jgi:hexosaminidase
MSSVGRLIVIFILLPIIIYSRSLPAIKAEPIVAITVAPKKNNDFNLSMVIQNDRKRSTWGIGFFMFNTLIKYKSMLGMQICEEDTKICTQLYIVTNHPGVSLSAGHVVLLSPSNDFVLQPDTTYKLSITGLQNIPRNITAMQQQVFFYNFTNKQVSYMGVSEYISAGYDQNAVKKALDYTVQKNWSMFAANNVPSYVVPSPVSVTYLQPKLLGYPTQSLVKPYYNSCIEVDANSINPNSATQKLYCKDIYAKPEGYVLSINPNNVTIYANTSAGYAYAQQTLSQLAYYYPHHIPFQVIVDYPQFKYRGIMLDTVRHFFKVEEIRKLINIMYASKLNTLHLHLSDDEGWRVELTQYKKLTQIGSVRGLNAVLPPANLFDDQFDITNHLHKHYETVESLYRGFYSQEELKDLIAYANKRQITIIPEIEMPAHARAMKLSMPEVFVESADKSIYYSIQGYNDNVLPVCKYGVDKKFTSSINGIVRDIAHLFSGQTTVYAIDNEISLSGDEVPENAWSDLSYCKNGEWANLQCKNTDSISEKSLLKEFYNKVWKSPSIVIDNSSEDTMHKYFRDISHNLPQYKISGWQQMVQDDDGLISESYAIAAKNIGHIWEWQKTNESPISGYTMAANLLSKSYPVVLSFADLTYFDIRYSPNFEEPGLYWASDYASTFDALSIGFSISNIRQQHGFKDIYLNNLLGVEGAIWSEVIPSEEHLFYMALPKMLGLAEAAWVEPNKLNWRSLAFKLGCGDIGFLTYLNKKYEVSYRGYPNGISLEVPPHTICNKTK